ncbi:MAG: vitamin K epoxide reductase [SAR324 cluster bacterium]|nr:vitamin K epoxide reductase [SAR324 cluster bacterium]
MRARIQRTGLLIVLLLGMNSHVVLSKQPVIQAVLFFSPTCPHCHQIMTEYLPPLLQKYGKQLQIATVNISTPEGKKFYQNAIAHFNIPKERWGVPTLILGETILVGALEIPASLTGLIEAGIQQGGINWPAVPGLDEKWTQPDFEASAEERSFLQNFLADPAGNTLAVIVLVGMILSLGGVGYLFRNAPENLAETRLPRKIPVLAVLGIMVATYLSYLEISHSVAICGPVGDCNTVQQSSYAYLWGWLPVGVAGVVGYGLILAIWLFQYYGIPAWKPFWALLLWGISLAGTLFAIYLTFLEPFIIGATCIWCLTSSLLITGLLWSSTKHAGNAWKSLPRNKHLPFQ